MGPANLRSSLKPTINEDAVYRGGTAFERSPRARPVKESRCYTAAYSYQDAPNIASATAGSKYIGPMDDNLALRKQVNLVRHSQLSLTHPLTSG